MEHSSAGTMNGSAKRGAGDSAINTLPEPQWPQRPWMFTGENEASVWGGSPSDPTATGSRLAGVGAWPAADSGIADLCPFPGKGPSHSHTPIF